MLRPCRQLLRRDIPAAVVFYMTPQAIAGERESALREARKFGFLLRTSSPIALPGGAGSRQFLVAVKGTGPDSEVRRWHEGTTPLE